MKVAKSNKYAGFVVVCIYAWDLEKLIDGRLKT